MELKKIVFATANMDKLDEIKQIWGNMYEIISLKDIGFDDEIIENGNTFEENALIKARAVAKKTDLPVFADDSGLEIDFLNKEPGIYSARYLGHETPYSEKNKMILERLKDVPDEKRTARFVCAIAGVLPDGKEISAIGTIEGIIAHKICGEHGFGYDPIFYVPKLGKTTAELSPEYKNSISHRGAALKAAKEKLEAYKNSK